MGICGASAALAISAILPDKNKTLEQNTLCAIICVNILSTIAMVVYPLFANFLHLTPIQTGLFFGLSIHDVAQAIGAGISVSDDVANTAVITKLIRVAFLSLVVVLVSLSFRNHHILQGKSPPILPFFLVMFLVFVGLNSMNIIPTNVTNVLITVSKVFLVASIVALGMKTQLSSLKTVGYKPIVLSIFATVFIVVASLISVHYI